MLNLLVYVVLIPVTVFVLLRYGMKRRGVNGNTALLVSACVLFGISSFFPSPLIHGHDTLFMTHLLGGGVFVGLIWLYLRPALPTVPWYYELFLLYSATSALGVLNELYETVVFEMGGLSTINDTSYDLVANTLGILLFYGVYKLTKALK